MLTVCRLEHRPRHLVSRLTATAITRGFGIGAQAYVVTNFFDAPLKTGRAVIAPPIVRPIVRALEPSEGEHIVVYWTTGTEERRLKKVLRKFSGQTFYVYGFNTSITTGNCVFKRPSTEGFLTDLASARGVVASAGLSLISECMHLRKRMLLLPLPGQYEQLINARYFEELGLGTAAKRLDASVLARFLRRIDEPMPQDDRILWPDNEKFFETLEVALSRLQAPISIAVDQVDSEPSSSVQLAGAEA